MRNALLGFTLTFVSIGCATAAKTAVTTNPAGQYSFENEVVITRSFEEVWDKLVAQLSKSFFVINNIAKDSRLINLSFSTDAPESYIDCGWASRTYEKNANIETYEYAIAEDSSFKWAKQLTTNSYADYLINRATGLEGRINVYIAPEGDDTRISVNTRYIFSVDVTGNYVVYGGAMQIQQAAGNIDPQHHTLSFNTGESGSSTFSTAGNDSKVECVCTGKLEDAIIAMVMDTTD